MGGFPPLQLHPFPGESLHEIKVFMNSRAVLVGRAGFEIDRVSADPAAVRVL